MANYRDIALRASVSKATVSRVLNNKSNVDTSTRTAVLQAAMDLGYPLEKRHRGGSAATRTVLLLVRQDSVLTEQGAWGLADEFETRAMEGMRSVFDKCEILTRLQRLGPEETQRAKAAEFAREVLVAGVVLLGGIATDEFIAGLRSASKAFVVVGAYVRGHDVSCVTADYSNGMLQVTQHMTKMGRRRVALVNGPALTTSSSEKAMGFRAGLAMAGLECPSNYVRECGFGYDSGFRETVALLRETPEVDAIAFAEDLMAVGGLRAVRESGRKVPDDIAVTGFYDYRAGAFSDPPLTTVHFDIGAMGSAAARLLRFMMTDWDETTGAWQLVFPTSLIVRGSV